MTTTARLAATWILVLLLFGIWPGIDIWASALFFDTETGRFPLNDSAALELLRNIIWNAANLALLACMVFGTFALLATRETAVPGRVWAFAVALIFLGPILIVNGVLKAYWGRARPADTDIFGGDLPFSQAWHWAGNCPSNCSFVSGEAAAVTCLAIILALVLWHNVADRKRLLFLLIALVILGASLRLMKGRHYLSDITWSVLITLTLAHLLAWRMRVYEVWDRVTFKAIRQDAACIWAAVKSIGGRGAP